MERRKRVFPFIVIGGGVVLFILAWSLSVIRPSQKIQLTGISDSFSLRLKGGLVFQFPNASEIYLRAEELELDSTEVCSLTVLPVLGDSGLSINFPYNNRDSLYTLRVKPPPIFNFMFQHPNVELPPEVREEIEKNVGGDIFWTYINSGDNEIHVALKTWDSKKPFYGSYVAVYGITNEVDSTVFQIISPENSLYPIELIPFYTRPVTKQTVWKLQFPSDSLGTFREWDLGKIPTSKLRIYGFARRPVIRLKPYAMPLGGPLDSLINSSFGIGVRYGYDLAQKNEISSEGRSVMVLKTVLGENADSLTLRITSPLRPLPFVILNGDEIILKGKFALKAKPGTRNITMQLTGLATSIRLNDKELLPRYLEVYRDWLIALLSITASISVILSFLGKWFFEWPWPYKGQAEKPRPRYRPFWMRRTRR